jgi:hypothetical protein
MESLYYKLFTNVDPFALGCRPNASSKANYVYESIGNDAKPVSKMSWKESPAFDRLLIDGVCKF